ncbi:MAG: diacylglycerol kinase [Patescibacteria group bacterium]
MFNFIKKFHFAFKGLTYVLRHELSFKIQIIITILVLLAAGFRNFSSLKWILLLLTIGFVLTAELFNTALEKILDLHEPRLSRHVGLLKDILAGAVLVVSVVAVVVGVILFTTNF